LRIPSTPLMGVIVISMALVGGCGRGERAPTAEEKAPRGLLVPDMVMLDGGNPRSPQITNQYRQFVVALAKQTATSQSEVIDEAARVKYLLSEKHGIEVSYWNVLQGVWTSMPSSGGSGPFREWADKWMAAVVASQGQ